MDRIRPEQPDLALKLALLQREAHTSSNPFKPCYSKILKTKAKTITILKLQQNQAR